MSLQLIEYTNQFPEKKWNDFIRGSINGTIFHCLDFLKYHGNKFENKEFHLCWLKGEEILCAFSCKIENGKLFSPYGASYGGFVWGRDPSYEESEFVVSSFLDFAKEKKISEIFITPTNTLLNEGKLELLDHQFCKYSFQLYNAEIISVIPSVSHRNYNSRVKRNLKKASTYELSCTYNDDITSFWEILEKNQEKFGLKPTHTLDEWKFLMKEFPQQVSFACCSLRGRCISGLGLLRLKPNYLQAFYICSDENLKDTQSLTFLIDQVLNDIDIAEVKYFDFGTSSKAMTVNYGILTFKESFGSMFYVRNSYCKKL